MKMLTDILKEAMKMAAPVLLVVAGDKLVGRVLPLSSDSVTGAVVDKAAGIFGK